MNYFICEVHGHSGWEPCPGCKFDPRVKYENITLDTLRKEREVRAKEFDLYLKEAGTPAIIGVELVKAFNEGFSGCAEYLFPLVKKQSEERKDG